MTEWHLDDELAGRYAAGTLAVPLVASLEAHVASCSRCQSALAPTVPRSRLDAVWTEVLDRVDTPTVTPLERLLARAGMSESDARLVVSAPALRLAWVLSVALVLLFSLVASNTPRFGPDVFLLLAPVLPVLGVGLAYGPWVDSSYEVTQSAPYSSVRLILLRTGLVLAVTVLLAAAAGALLPGDGTAIVWLLPAAALVAVTLALAAWVPPLTAAIGTSVCWVVALLSLWRHDASLDPAFALTGQLAALVLIAVAVIASLLARRVQAYDLRRFL